MTDDDPGALAALRAAAGRLEALHHSAGEGQGTTDAAGDLVDPMEHAARFEALHDALVAVLAEIQYADQAGPSAQVGPVARVPDHRSRT